MEWQQTPLQNELVPGTGLTASLAILNSGISLDREIITQLNDESLRGNEHQSPHTEVAPAIRDQALAPNSPILLSPMSPITAYPFTDPNDDMLAEDGERAL